MTDHRGRSGDSRRAVVGWLPSVCLMLLGAMVSQDVEGHLLAGTVLLVAAVLVLAIAYRLDVEWRKS